MAGQRKLVHSLFTNQLLLVALPLAIIAALIYIVLVDDLEQRAHQQNLVLSTAIAEQVSEFLDTPRVLLLSLGLQQGSFNNAQLDQKRYLMDELIARTGLFDVIYLLSSSNQVVAAGLPEDRRALRSNYEQVMGGGQRFAEIARATDRMQWSDTYLSVQNSSTSVGLAMPLVGDEVMVGSFSIEKLSHYVASLELGSDSLALIVDRRGNIIAHPDIRTANQQLNISNQPLINLALGGKEQTGQLLMNGERYVASTQVIGEVGWVVIAATPYEQVMYEIHHIMWVLAFGALVAAVLALLLSRWMALRLAQPIVGFSEATNQVKRGEFNLHFPESNLHEVGVLAENFQQMAQELLQQQQSLRASERQYRELVDQVPCVICRMEARPGGRVLYIGKPIEGLSGYAPGYFLRKDGLELEGLIHPSDRDIRKQLIDQRTAKRLPWGVEYRLLHHDGSIRWVIEEGQASFNGGDEPQHYDLMLIDNTQRKRSERNQREQAEMMLTLLDTVPSPIFYQNAYHEMLGCNRAFEQFFGVQQAAMMGKTTEAVSREHPLLGQVLDPPEALLLQANESSRDLRLVLAERTRHISLSQASFLDAEGRVAGLIGVVHDLTERVEAEEDTLRLRRYFGNVIDSMPSAVIGVSAEEKILQLNREARNRLQHLGVPTSSDYQTILQRFGLQAEWIRRCTLLQQVDVIRRQPRADGSRYEDITIYPLDQNVGGGAVIRIDDVTEQVRFEEALVQSEKMLSVGGLAAGMAHEINNPLAGILQNAQVLNNRIEVDLPANQRAARECDVELEDVRCYLEKRAIPEMLAAIADSGNRAARIVENMLNFARKSESDFIRTDLAELLDQTVELAINDYDLKKNYDFRNIEIITDYRATQRVRCAPSKLQQVFFNLIKNSAQAISSYTATTGVTPRITLRLSDLPGKVRIEVEDNGPGMDSEVAKRVFEPFYTTKEVGVGTGLGLSVSYFIVTENHSGTMWVESSPGCGACFKIELPAATPEEDEA